MQQQATILFVDSDANQLRSLQRTLRDQRERWRLLFAEDSDSALSRMAREPIDILVSETRLDGCTGSELLKLAHKRYPLTTRLLFSGQGMREPAQEVVRYTHQFIAKPCDKATLVTILQRVTQLRGMLHNPDLR
jgi:DNA-binding NtrC family response regulator